MSPGVPCSPAWARTHPAPLSAPLQGPAGPAPLQEPGREPRGQVGDHPSAGRALAGQRVDTGGREGEDGQGAAVGPAGLHIASIPAPERGRSWPCTWSSPKSEPTSVARTQPTLGLGIGEGDDSKSPRGCCRGWELRGGPGVPCPPPGSSGAGRAGPGQADSTSGRCLRVPAARAGGPDERGRGRGRGCRGVGMQLGWAQGARSSLPAAQGGNRLWDRLPRDLLPPDPLLLLAQRLRGDAGSALPRFNNPSPVPGRIKRMSGFVQPVELPAAGAGPAAPGRVPGAQISAKSPSGMRAALDRALQRRRGPGWAPAPPATAEHRPWL